MRVELDQDERQILLLGLRELARAASDGHPDLLIADQEGRVRATQPTEVLVLVRKLALERDPASPFASAILAPCGSDA